MADELGDNERVHDIRDEEAARALLRTFVADPNFVSGLRDLLCDDSSPATLSEWEDDEVLEAVASRIAAVHLTPVQRPRVYRSAETIVAPDRPGPVAVLSPSKETTWVEIQLVDEEGEPVSGRAYELTLPDGTVQKGTLNFRGRARVDDIEEPGACTLRFAELDADAWERI